MDKGKVEVCGLADKFLIGQVYGDNCSVNEFLKTIEKSPSGIITSDNILYTLWDKILFVSSLNPIGALLNLTFCEISASPNLSELVKNIIAETIPIINSQNIKFDLEQTLASILRKATGAGYHECSMSQDVKNHKRTEIDYLNGGIALLGKKLGFSTPINDTLTLLIKAKEASYLET